jgi:hypothetical protein
MNNKNLPLIVGMVLPLFFIAVVSLVIFLPSISVKPEHNFIFSDEGDYYNGGYKNFYKVKDGVLTLEPVSVGAYDKAYYVKDYPKIFVYDVKKHTSKEITLEEAKKLDLDPGPSSVDGYNIVYEGGHYGIFEIFGSNDGARGYFIAKGNAKKKLSGLLRDGYGYNYNFKFIGWIK